MPYRNLYLSEKEDEYVKTQDDGYIRRLVKEAMKEKSPKKATPIVSVNPNFIFQEKSSHKREIGWCVNVHFAGVGTRACKLCKGKVYGK